MLKYNFDEPVNRKGTNCLKYDASEIFFGTSDIIPMWVADMDFKTPDFVVEGIMKRAASDIYGYSMKPAGYYDSIISWMKNRHGWIIEKDWIIYCPGVVPAFNMAVLAYTSPGDRVIVQPPVYFPFFSAIKDHGRTLVYNPLRWTGSNYAIDLENLEDELSRGVKLMLFCSPHNPVGRVWNKSELEAVSSLCCRYGAILLSDEIHCDLIYPSFKHIPIASLNNDAAQNTVTCIAPSKTFNLAGMATSCLIIENKTTRDRFVKVLDSLHLGMGNIFGIAASEAAYKHGSAWVDQLMEYLQGNLDYLTEFAKEHMPDIRVIVPEATYLVWLDFSKLAIPQAELKDWLIKKAHLGMNDGTSFGPGGEGFMRMNIACPRTLLSQALEQLKAALAERN